MHVYNVKCSLLSTGHYLVNKCSLLFWLIIYLECADEIQMQAVDVADLLPRVCR